MVYEPHYENAIPLHSQSDDMPCEKLKKVKDLQNSCKRIEYPTM